MRKRVVGALLLTAALSTFLGCIRPADTTGVTLEYMIPQRTGSDGSWGFGVDGWTAQGWGVRGGYHWVPVFNKRAFTIDIGGDYVVSTLNERLHMDIQSGIGAYWVHGDFASGPVVSAGFTLFLVPGRVALSARYVYAPVLMGSFPADELSRISAGISFEVPLQ